MLKPCNANEYSQDNFTDPHWSADHSLRTSGAKKPNKSNKSEKRGTRNETFYRKIEPK